MSTAPITCAQIAALPDQSWINDGFIATVLKVDTVPKKAGGNFWKLTLGDSLGDYTHGCTMSLFAAPRCNPGDVIRVTGKGISKKSYQGKPQVGMGKESTLEVMPSSARIQSNVESSIAEVKGNRAAEKAECMIPGQTVGMAIKEALALHSIGLDNQTIKLQLTAPGFWSDVYATASDIIRVSRLLESGKLCDPVKQRSAPAQGSRQVPAQPKHDPESELDAQDENVPF